ncbi:hypothetical protein C5167_030958 [Papaver somniferum]|nr:hypothetical protein C5167_030958 [Papaver somniferum]
MNEKVREEANYTPEETLRLMLRSGQQRSTKTREANSVTANICFLG